MFLINIISMKNNSKILIFVIFFAIPLSIFLLIYYFLYFQILLIIFSKKPIQNRKMELFSTFFIWNLFFPLFAQKVFYINSEFNDPFSDGSYEKPFNDIQKIYNISTINENNVAILLGNITCNGTFNNVFGLTIM